MSNIYRNLNARYGKPSGLTRREMLQRSFAAGAALLISERFTAPLVAGAGRVVVIGAGFSGRQRMSPIAFFDMSSTVSGLSACAPLYAPPRMNTVSPGPAPVEPTALASVQGAEAEVPALFALPFIAA